jgi:tetratricopeptide (TPR) repeat protein
MKKSWKILTVFLAVAVLAAAVCLAWYYSPSSRAGRLTILGIEAGKKADIEKAQQYFEEAVRIAPGHFLARFNLGEIYSSLERNEQAAAEFHVADAIRPKDSLTLYELARLSARMEKREEAFLYLERAIDAGFDDIPRLNGDEDFTTIHKDSRFKDLFNRWQALKQKNDGGAGK